MSILEQPIQERQHPLGEHVVRIHEPDVFTLGMVQTVVSGTADTAVVLSDKPGDDIIMGPHPSDYPVNRGILRAVINNNELNEGRIVSCSQNRIQQTDDISLRIEYGDYDTQQHSAHLLVRFSPAGQGSCQALWHDDLTCTNHPEPVYHLYRTAK